MSDELRKCLACGGLGWRGVPFQYTFRNITCPDCDGTGKQTNFTEAWVTCPVCDGQPGDFDNERFGCDHCHGGGTVAAERAVSDGA